MDDLQQSSFSGPLTLAEVKKCLSVKRSPVGITRRATISDLIPSRNIYADYEELNIWKRMDFCSFSDDPDTCLVDQYLSLPPFIPLANANNMSPYLTYVNQVSQILKLCCTNNEDDLCMENFVTALSADLSSADSEIQTPIVTEATKNIEKKTETKLKCKNMFMLQSKLNL